MTRLQRSGPRPTSGFTVIEVVIVAVLIGLIAVIALPNIDFSRYRIDAAMRAVAAGLQAAQRRAVSRQHDVVVSFDIANQVITLHEDANNNQEQDPGELVRAIPMGDQVAIAQGSAPAHPLGGGPITFTRDVGGLVAVTFHRNGSASEAGAVYLTSRRAINTGAHPDDTRLIEIERGTGRVSWWKYLPSGWRQEF